MRLKVAQCQWIPEQVRACLERQGRVSAKQRELSLQSDMHRTQEGNRQQCLDNLVSLLRQMAKDAAPMPTSDEKFSHVQKLYFISLLLVRSPGRITREKERQRLFKEHQSRKKRGRRVPKDFD